MINNYEMKTTIHRKRQRKRKEKDNDYYVLLYSLLHILIMYEHAIKVYYFTLYYFT